MRIIGLFFPFIAGGGIAFVLNVPMQFIERNIFGRGKRKDSKIVRKIARPVSLVLAILIAVFVIFIVGNVVIPELGLSLIHIYLQWQKRRILYGGYCRGFLHTKFSPGGRQL